MARHRLHRADPEQRRASPRTGACSARSRTGSRSSSTGGSDMGPDGLPGQGRLPAHRRQRGRPGLGPVRLRQDAGLPLGHLPRRAGAGPRGSTSATTRAQPAWQDVPGEYRGTLRRLIVTQGDTEPASVEQQRHLGRTCPSLYDLRNLFQVNVEEGRHLWAMVYLLDAHFGRDGREESEALLQRRSGDRDKPRILGAFNEKTPDWLSFFMFCFFTDRDGKYQLASLAESGFDPLSRTCRFMLTEEAHHMFVGEAGIGRIVQRTCELMREHKTDDVRPPRRHRPARRSRSTSTSTARSRSTSSARRSRPTPPTSTRRGSRAASRRRKKTDDHRLKDGDLLGDRARGRRASTMREEPALVVAERAAARRLRRRLPARRRPLERDHQEARHRRRAHAAPPRLPPGHRRLRRGPGVARRPRRQPGRVGRAACATGCPPTRTRPTSASLMQPVIEPGKFASWIAPPARGHQRPADRFRVRAAGGAGGRPWLRPIVPKGFGPPLGMYSHGMIARAASW